MSLPRVEGIEQACSRISHGAVRPVREGIGEGTVHHHIYNIEEFELTFIAA